MTTKNRVSLFILAIGVTLSILSGWISHTSEIQRAKDSFIFNIQQVEVALKKRLSAYELVLRGAAAFYENSPSMTREQWRSYVRKLRRDGAISEVQGIGFAKKILPSELASFEQQVQQEGFETFRVTPVGTRDMYSSILYLEPFDERNRRAFGYDMFSEKKRRTTMLRAAETGDVAMSPRVELLQETSQDVQPGTLMYIPIYNLERLNRGTQPLEALIGWAYSPFRMTDLIEGIIGGWELDEGAAIGLSIFDDNEVSPAHILYSNMNYEEINNDYLEVNQTFEFAGRKWLLMFKHKHEVQELQLWRPIVVCGLGLLLTLALLGYARLLNATRDRAVKIAGSLTKQLQQKQHEIAHLEERWRFAVEATNSGVWDWQVTDDQLYLSDGWYRLFKLPNQRKYLTLQEAHQKIHAGDLEQVEYVIEKALKDSGIDNFELQYRITDDGHDERWVLDRGSVVSRDSEGRAIRIVGTVEDITESQNEIHALKSEAQTDKLTGLYNRSFLINKLESLLTNPITTPTPLGVIFIDVNHFKPINDKHGHDAGDVVLREFARRFQATVRASDIVCRLGGDEFVIVLVNADLERLNELSVKLCEVTQDPIYYEDKELNCGASVGAIQYDFQLPATPIDLLRAADALMYEAKHHASRHFVIGVYDHKMAQHDCSTDD
jgi:PAS domain S-box/diguanylate cyclase (GGDEF) domain